MNAIADMTATRTAVLDEAHASHIQGIASREARVRHREHRSGTPNLLELGCLAVIAGLVSLLDKERVALFAKLTETAEELRRVSSAMRKPTFGLASCLSSSAPLP